MADTEVGSLIVRVRTDLTDTLKQLDAFDKQAKTTESGVTKAMGKVSTALTAGSAALGVFAAAAVKNAMAWGTAVDDLSDKTGLAGEKASELLVVAQRVNIGTEEASMMFARLARSAYTAAQAQESLTAENRTTVDAFTALNIAVTNADGTMKDTATLFGEVKDKIADMPDGLQKTALEMELFGRSGAKMHDLLNMSSQEMQEVTKQARAMGLILSTEQAAAWERFEREINTAKQSMAAVGISIGNTMLPSLKSLLDMVTAATRAFIGWSDANKGLSDGLIQLAAGAGTALVAVRGLALLAGAAVSPWVALAAAIAGATIAITNFSNKNVDWVLGPDGTMVPIPKGLSSPSQGMGDLRQSTRAGDYANPAAGGGPPIAGTGGAGDTKTALQEYLDQMNKVLQVEEQRYQLTGDAEAYKQVLLAQYDGLENVVAGTDEVIDKESALNSLKLRAIDLVNEEARAQRQADDAIQRSLEERRQGAERLFEEQKKQVVDLVKEQIDAAKKTQNAWQDVFVGILSGDGFSNIGRTLQREAATWLVKGESPLFGSRNKKEPASVEGFTDEQNKALNGFLGTINAGTSAMTILNGITTILGMTTKPAEAATTAAATGAKAAETGTVISSAAAKTAETAATVTATASIVAMTTAAVAATAAMAAMAASGGGSFLFGLFEKGGIVPSAARGMITPNVPGGIPAILHKKEMVLPSQISDFIMNTMADVNQAKRRRAGDINIIVNEAKNMNVDQLARKLGRKINNRL
ncbi:phage tail tape measure protein [Anaeroselena agilis]|uniref:Phage tail tape measure protein n=1 Tax=Anaeroselena agilis TaxID=3063788 RepID=A0ABU3NWI3_9FIRM|nr:phage tail tape measure protein [Selenomonadales bacterium 4137-cl]